MSASGRLVGMAAGALCVTVLALLVTFNVLMRDGMRASMNRVLVECATAENEALYLVRGHLVPVHGAGGVATGGMHPRDEWAFDGTRLIESPDAPAALTTIARTLARGDRRFVDASRYGMRLYAQPVVRNGRRYGTVVAFVNLRPYRQSEHLAFWTSASLALALIAIVTTFLLLTTRRMLRPVDEMAAAAHSWSEHDLERRFVLRGPDTEIRRLGATFNSLLDRVAESLRRERRLTSELSHELRTPLARIAGQTELALARDRSNTDYRTALQSIERSADQMRSIIDSLLSLARVRARGDGGLSESRGDMGRAAATVVDLLGERAATRGVRLHIERPLSGMTASVDDGAIERMLQPIVENACAYARSRAVVEIGETWGKVTVLVRDDGPGVSAQEAHAIFEPGARGSAGVQFAPATGTGLGLALARRLARSAGGDVVVDVTDGGGSFQLLLPKG